MSEPTTQATGATSGSLLDLGGGNTGGSNDLLSLGAPSQPQPAQTSGFNFMSQPSQQTAAASTDLFANLSQPS